MRMPIHATLSGRLLASAALALALAGCAGGGNSQGTFGAPGVDVEPGVGQRISDKAAAGVGGPSQPPPALTVGSGPNAIEYSCPMLDVRSGAGSWQLEANGGLRVQGSLGQLARECAIVGNSMAIKVGIEGRLVLGEKGAPGVFNVPIRIAVVQEGPNPKTITTKYFVVPVNIPAGESQMLFSVVEDQLSIPLAKPEEVERYVVYVGFDPKGDAGTPRTSSRPARPKPAATSSAPAASEAPAASSSTRTPPATPASSTSTTPSSSSSTPSSGSSSSSNSSNSGGFAAPPTGTFGPAPTTGTFGPPPATFGPAPATSSQ